MISHCGQKTVFDEDRTASFWNKNSLDIKNNEKSSRIQKSY